VSGAFVGIKPVVIAVVAQALWGLGRTALKNPPLVAIAVGAAIASLSGVGPLAILVAAGVVATLAARARRGPALAALLPFGTVPAAPAFAPPTLGKIFLFFLKVGSVLYGSGYLLLSFLQSDLVDRWHWLTKAQLLDAVAVGQFTPGPVFTTATFIGYLLGSIFPRVRGSPAARAFLNGVNAGALALMLTVALVLGRAAIVDPTTVALAVGAAILLIRSRVDSAWLILGGAVLGAALAR
jgi:chromate transporter